MSFCFQPSLLPCLHEAWFGPNARPRPVSGENSLPVHLGGLNALHEVSQDLGFRLIKQAGQIIIPIYLVTLDWWFLITHGKKAKLGMWHRIGISGSKFNQMRKEGEF